MECAVCNLLACLPGLFPVPCQNVTECACTVCADGFFFDRDRCAPCTPSVWCPPGFVSAPCSAAGDTQCVPCAPLKGDGYEWLNGCDFTCDEDHFMADGVCHPCRDDPCPTGTYATNCSLYADAACLDCLPPAGPFAWTDGCGFQCADGHFLDGAACVVCGRPNCTLGQRPGPCTPWRDSGCEACEPGRGKVWVDDACGFECAHGYFRLEDRCEACNETAECAPGQYVDGCTNLTEPLCVPCGGRPEGRRWTLGCDFECADSFYLSDGGCARCTEGGCGAGQYRSNCTAEADSTCSACPDIANARFTEGCSFQCSTGYAPVHGRCEACPNPGGAFTWLDSCAFECATGFVLVNGTVCEASPPGPPVITRVHTTLQLDNTVDEVCHESAALLEAWSRILMGIMGNGSVPFETNLTHLNGVACGADGCPQCRVSPPAYGGMFGSDRPLDAPELTPPEMVQDKAPATTTTAAIEPLEISTEALETSTAAFDETTWETTSRGRRLLSSGVDAVVVSQSAQPVANVSGVSPVQLTAALAAALNNTALQATAASVNVTTIAPTIGTLDVEWVWMAIGLFVVITLMVAGCCVRICYKHRRR